MDQLAKFFDSAYLINLPDRADRLRSAKRELVRAGFDVEGGQVQVFSAIKFANRGSFPNVGARGCFYSHLECLRQAFLDGRQRVLIMEDDIAFSRALPRLASCVRSHLETLEWDFAYLGHEETGKIPRARSDATEVDFAFRSWLGDILTAHCYAISGRILKRLIQHLETTAMGPEGDDEHGPMPYDGALNIFRRKNSDVRCYIAEPKLTWPRPSRSDITPRAFDNANLLRPIISLLRELKYMGYRWR
jgi:glycosyl transferase, family 25